MDLETEKLEAAFEDLAGELPEFADRLPEIVTRLAGLFQELADNAETRRLQREAEDAITKGGG